MKQYIIGRKKGDTKVHSYTTVHDAQIEATDGWSIIYGANVEAAKRKFEDSYKSLHSKKKSV